MATAPLVLGVTPISSTYGGVSQWDVQLEVDDPSERYSGFDVAVGDVVYLDLVSSTTAPGTVGRYVVQALVTRSAALARAVLAWGGVGAAVDPVEAAGQRGYLTRPSSRNGLAWHPTSRQMQVEQRLIDGAKNVEMFAVVDLFDSSVAPSPDEVARGRQVVEVVTPRTFTYGQVVSTRPGTGALACPQEADRMPGIGLAIGMGVGTVHVQTEGVIRDLPYALLPGVEVWVSDNGGLTQDANSVSRPGALQLIGVAVTANSMVLSPPGLTVKRV